MQGALVAAVVRADCNQAKVTGLCLDCSLEAQETDITIMMNVPISVSVKSASAKVMKEVR